MKVMSNPKVQPRYDVAWKLLTPRLQDPTNPYNGCQNDIINQYYFNTINISNK